MQSFVTIVKVIIRDDSLIEPQVQSKKKEQKKIDSVVSIVTRRTFYGCTSAKVGKEQAWNDKAIA